MGVRLDPCDQSKVFGQHLNNLLERTIELEFSDFRECLFNGDFEDNLTKRELERLTKWANAYNRGTAGVLPRALLLKSGHPFGVASVLWAMIADGE